MVAALASISLYILPFYAKLGGVEVTAFRVLLVIVILTLSVDRVPLRRIVGPTIVDLSLLALAFWLMASVLWSPEPIIAFRYTVDFAILTAYFFVLRSLAIRVPMRTADRTLKLLAVMTTVGLGTYMAIFQVGVPGSTSPESIVLGSNILAMGVVPFLPVAFAALANARSSRPVFVGWTAVAAAIVFIVYLSQSRSGFLGLLITLVLAIVGLALLGPRMLPRIIAALALVIAFTSIMVGGSRLAQNLIPQRITETVAPILSAEYRSDLAEQQKIVGFGRWDMYRFTIDALQKDWPLGHGLGVVQEEMEQASGRGFVAHNDLLA